MKGAELGQRLTVAASAWKATVRDEKNKKLLQLINNF